MRSVRDHWGLPLGVLKFLGVDWLDEWHLLNSKVAKLIYSHRERKTFIVVLLNLAQVLLKHFE